MYAEEKGRLAPFSYWKCSRFISASRLEAGEAAGVPAAEALLTRILGRSKAEFDDGARVGDQFGLPAVVALEFLHGGFRSGVPMPRGLAGEVTGFDQRCLNLGSAGVVDSALTGGFGRFRAFIEELRRGGAATCMGRCRAW